MDIGTHSPDHRRVAGWLAGLIVKGYGFGLLATSSSASSALHRSFVAHAGVALAAASSARSSATIGAVILLFLIRLIKRA